MWHIVYLGSCLALLFGVAFPNDTEILISSEGAPQNNSINSVVSSTANITALINNNKWFNRKPQESLVQYTKHFTTYHLYFRTDIYESRQQCFINGWMDWRNSSSIAKVVDHCPNQDYYPPHVLRSQISWKPTPTNNDNNKETNAKSSEAASSDYRGDENMANKTAESSSKKTSTKAASEDESDFHVHKYLIIALLLPNHPYSDEIFRSIRRVAPMFPMISFVTGDGYEFRDIASKYFVTTMPTMILFKNGLYVGDSEIRDDVGLAVKLATWTKSLPRSLPLSVRMDIATPSAVYLQLPPKFIQSDKHWMVMTTIRMLQDVLNYIPLPYPNLEPFVGSMPRYREMDLIFFIFSAFYCFGRGIYVIRSSFVRPR